MRSVSGMVGNNRIVSGISDDKGNSLSFLNTGELYLSSASTSAEYNIPYASSIALPLFESNILNLELSGDTTLIKPTMLISGTWYLVVKQGPTGGHSVNLDSIFKVTQGSIQRAANSRSLVQIIGLNNEYHLSITSLSPV